MNARRGLAVVFTLCAWVCTCSALVPVTDNLVGYWPFDETSGGIAHAASGYGQNGTLINFPGGQGAWVGGQISGSLEFGGLAAQQYVRVPDFTKPTTSLTLSAWIWADSTPQWATVAANWNGLYGTLNYGMFGSYPYLSFYFADGGGAGFISVANGSEGGFSPMPVPPLSLGAWHHVAVVANGAEQQVEFWRDGQNAGAFFYSGSFYPAPVPQLNIGGEPTHGNPNQGYWDGKIDDLAIWTRALSAQEVAAIYNAGLSGQPLISLVPEPSAFALFSAGLFGILLLRHRSQREFTENS